ncbi:hypothetical protein BIW11_05258 [Tropilaelaps mercedesae]|uniref:Apple domain-containing protein n=1 Tax=Tropilaelaps mercedesae TaxID=418985 RepID=A0A1V9Y2Z8_9ACAR|nr:hypothetical protein BIW11_05258 [Tropilaelaps mercedesae]
MWHQCKLIHPICESRKIRMRLTKSSGLPALWVGVLLVVLVNVHAQDVHDANTLPSLLPDGFKGVTITVEVSTDFRTFVVKEVHDQTDDISLLEYFDTSKKVVQYMFADRKKKLTLLYNEASCTIINDTDAVYKSMLFMTSLGIRTVPERQDGHPRFIGPASVFEDFIARKNRSAPVNCTIDLMLPCDLYTEQSDFTTTNHFIFSTKQFDLLGRNESRPLRLLVRSENHAVDVEVLSIKLSNVSMDLFIPTGLSCQVPVPNFKDFPHADSLEFEAEVVVKGRGLKETYISQLNGIYLPSLSHYKQYNQAPSLVSFSYSTWKMNDSLGNNYTANIRVREIFDLNHMLFYLHIDSDEPADGTTCATLKIADELKATLPLPKYGEIDLENLFLRRPERNNSETPLAYLGKNKVGHIDVEVFEVTYKNYATGKLTLDKVIVTHYILANKPLSIEINGFDSIGKLFNVIMDVSKVSTELIELNKKFRIDDCYATGADKLDYRWFQVAFEVVNTTNFKYLSLVTPRIKESFLKTLYEKYDLQPMRIPYVSINFGSGMQGKQVSVNTLLLEAPLIETQFGSIVGIDIFKPSKQLGVLTLPQCLRSCLAMGSDKCTAISYCGSTCAVTKDIHPTAEKNTKIQPGCTMFERKSNGSGKHTGYPVSMDILSKIRSDIETSNETKKLKVEFDLIPENAQKGVHIILKADTYDDTKDYESVFHFDNKRLPVLEAAFRISASKTRYIPANDQKDRRTEGPKKLGSFPIEDCGTACLNRADCESFSYCANDNECVISKTHDASSSPTKSDPHCVIYQIKYVERFDKFRGLTMESNGKLVQASSLENCAQKCVADETCKSFDFCETNSDNKCVLHQAHIIDAAENEVTTVGTCAHYSKRYLYDYKKKLHKHGGEGRILAAIDDETQAACAKRCSEWSSPDKICLSFDFCKPNNDEADNNIVYGRGKCFLRTQQGSEKLKESPTCDFLYYSAIHATKAPEEHGVGATLVMFVFMIFLGISLGIGAAIGYNKFNG